MLYGGQNYDDFVPIGCSSPVIYNFAGIKVHSQLPTFTFLATTPFQLAICV